MSKTREKTKKKLTLGRSGGEMTRPDEQGTGSEASILWRPDGNNQYSGEGAPEPGKDCKRGDELFRKMCECETE